MEMSNCSCDYEPTEKEDAVPKDAAKATTRVARTLMVVAGLSSTVMILTIRAQPAIAWTCAIVAISAVIGLAVVNRRLKRLDLDEIGVAGPRD